MKRKWYQWEKVINLQVPCDICMAKSFQEEFNQLCIQASNKEKPVFAGIISLPDGSKRSVHIVLGNEV